MPSPSLHEYLGYGNDLAGFLVFFDGLALKELLDYQFVRFLQYILAVTPYLSTCSNSLLLRRSKVCDTKLFYCSKVASSVFPTGLFSWLRTIPSSYSLMFIEWMNLLFYSTSKRIFL